MAAAPPAPWIGSVAGESVSWPRVDGSHVANWTAIRQNADHPEYRWWFNAKSTSLEIPERGDNTLELLRNLSDQLRDHLDANPAPVHHIHHHAPWSGQGNKNLKTRRLRLRPSTEQKEALRKAAGIIRWTYNRAVAYLREHPHATFHQVRQHSVNEEHLPEECRPWVTQVLYSIRQAAAKDAHIAQENGLQAVASGQIPDFHLEFRRKRAMFSSFKIRARDWRNGCLQISGLGLGTGPGKSRIGYGNRVVEVKHDDAIIKQENGRWFLLWTEDVDEEELAIPAALGPRMCAIDPGVRTFATIYDPLLGIVSQFGDGDKCRLFRLGLCLDNLISKCAQPDVRAKARYRMRRAANRLRARIRNLVDEVHRQLTSFLSHNYDTILLPTFNAHQMSRRGQRRIGRRTVRAMMTWAHGRFRSRLKKTMEVVEVVEDWTSKVCSKCGTVNYRLGGSKIHRCPGCHTISDRDINAAKNIFLHWKYDFSNP
ncbi:hypothetical protein CF319_g7796 [Tilletia indica]|nr:hypothetical protein CF319_g7796 [Tilletia indica]